MQNDIDRYCRYLYQKGQCDSTVKIARAALVDFSELVAKKPADVTRQDVERFVLNLRSRKNRNDEPLSVSHRNRSLSTVKRFFAFLEADEKIMLSPARDTRLFKEPDRIPRDVLTLDEVKRFLEAINQRTMFDKRGHCIFCLFYATGIRKGELERLELCDVDLDHGQLFVLGKGQKKRVVPLGPNICDILDHYIHDVRPKFVRYQPGQERLFVTVKGDKFTTDIINRMARFYAAKAGIDKKITAHSFRHTFATHLLENGAGIRHVQEILGHEDLKTTQIYTRVSIKSLKEVVDRFHPRGQNFQII